MLNKAIIIGRLTRDPELRRTTKGDAVTSFTLAVPRDFGDNAADFIPIVAWKGTAEFVSKHFRKGRVMVVYGRLQSREWTDKDGNKRTAIEIVAETVYFGDSKPEDKPEEKPEQLDEIDDIDGELPF